MGRRKYDNSDLALCEIAENRIDVTTKTPFKKTLRAYIQEGEFKIVKDKISFTDSQKNYLNMFNKYCEKYTDCIIELLDTRTMEILKVRSL